MSKTPRELSSEERRLWRRVASGVKVRRPKPLPDDDGEEEALPPVRKSAAAAKAAKAKPTTTSVRGPEAPLADRGSERRVKRGQVEIAARLDLHGYTQDRAFAALQTFLQRAHARDARTVLVITGAGRGGEGVLKRNLPLWLEDRSLKPIVSGFARAHRGHGGAGAAYVFLKRKSPLR